MISWSGMRGVVTLAAAFVIPETVPQRDTLVFLAFFVTIATLLLHGLTMPAVIRRLGGARELGNHGPARPGPGPARCRPGEHRPARRPRRARARGQQHPPRRREAAPADPAARERGVGAARATGVGDRRGAGHGLPTHAPRDAHAERTCSSRGATPARSTTRCCGGCCASSTSRKPRWTAMPPSRPVRRAAGRLRTVPGAVLRRAHLRRVGGLPRRQPAGSPHPPRRGRPLRSTRSSPLGFPGCVAYDCSARASTSVQVTFGGAAASRRCSPLLAIVRALCRALWYLAEVQDARRPAYGARGPRRPPTRIPPAHPRRRPTPYGRGCRRRTRRRRPAAAPGRARSCGRVRPPGPGRGALPARRRPGPP